MRVCIAYVAIIPGGLVSCFIAMYLAIINSLQHENSDSFKRIKYERFYGLLNCQCRDYFPIHKTKKQQSNNQSSSRYVPMTHTNPMLPTCLLS